MNDINEALTDDLHSAYKRAIKKLHATSWVSSGQKEFVLSYELSMPDGTTIYKASTKLSEFDNDQDVLTRIQALGIQAFKEFFRKKEPVVAIEAAIDRAAKVMRGE